MTEQTTPVANVATAPVPEAPKGTNKAKKKKAKKRIRNLIIAVVVIALLAVGGFLLWKFVFAEKKTAVGEPLFDMASVSSISSNVQGGGAASAKDSKTITLAAAGIVQEVLVTQGQVVAAGDPLYVITSAAAEEALTLAKESYQKQLEAMAVLDKEMAQLQKSRGELTITAPHGGKLTQAAQLSQGSQLTSGTKIADVVDDTRLKLSLYYSYAYETDIKVGQTASVSIPATMTTLTGTVETINKVERIVPEGGKTFEVVFVVDNPGTLTEGMAASAALKAANGAAIYPYEGGTFSYYKTTTISAKADGPIEQIKGLMNYAAVTPGQVLLVQGTNDVDVKITAKREQVVAAQKSLEAAAKKVADEQKNLENFSATAPIAGTVTACALAPGLEVASGLAAITISDNTIMTVNINVDERNVSYIKTGMDINLTDYNGGSYMGIVESVASVGKSENGITVFPVVVKVENTTGTLLGGMYLDYQFTAAQSNDCIVIPIQDVRYASLGDKKPTPVVYLQTDTAPADAIDPTTLPAEMQAEIPEGCYVIKVETGLSDDMNVEIKSGLKDGDMVFNNIPKPEGAWG